MSETTTIGAIAKTVHVACSRERAFDVFTREVGAWWPTDTHALHPGEVREVVWEEREGGEVVEITHGGERTVWGTVLAWDPPAAFRIAWLVNTEADRATEVEVRFTPEGEGTRVDLEHRYWERLGDRAAEVMGSYDDGWGGVLARYVAHADAAG